MTTESQAKALEAAKRLVLLLEDSYGTVRTPQPGTQSWWAAVLRAQKQIDNELTRKES